MIEHLSEKKSGKSFSYFSGNLVMYLRAGNCIETGALPGKITVVSHSPTKIPKENERKSHVMNEQRFTRHQTGQNIPKFF